MSKGTLLILLVVLLLASGSALAESNPQVRPAEVAESPIVEPVDPERGAAEDESEIAGPLFEPVFLQEPLPYGDPEPVEVCEKAERDTCNCNVDADCDARCGEGKCRCLTGLLDCSGYACSGSCR